MQPGGEGQARLQFIDGDDVVVGFEFLDDPPANPAGRSRY
jgi:hypothetical protein